MVLIHSIHVKKRHWWKSKAAKKPVHTTVYFQEQRKGRSLCLSPYHLNSEEYQQKQTGKTVHIRVISVSSAKNDDSMLQSNYHQDTSISRLCHGELTVLDLGETLSLCKEHLPTILVLSELQNSNLQVSCLLWKEISILVFSSEDVWIGYRG